jgi:hypothetical protein
MRSAVVLVRLADTTEISDASTGSATGVLIPVAEPVEASFFGSDIFSSRIDSDVNYQVYIALSDD